MRIAVVHNLAAGGAHRRLREQLAHISGGELEFREVCLDSAEPVSRDPDIVPYAPVAPGLHPAVRVPWRYADLVRLLLAWQEVARRVRALRPDAVFANPCRFLQAPAALAAGLAPSLYFCDEPRRVDHDPSAMGSRRRLTRPVYAALYRVERRSDTRSVAAASRLATNSGYTAREIARAYGRRAEVVPCGVAEAFRTAATASGGHVLSVGSLIPSKGHDIAIAGAALAGHRRPVIVVAPHGEPAEAARLESLARAHGVSLELRVGVSDAALAQLYAGAHATVYMSAREPLGLVSLEAQAAGSPVIVSDEGGLPETLAPGQGEWAVPRRADAVAAKLDALERPAVRGPASAAGRRHAQELTWERSARHIGDLLAELAG